MPDSTWLLPPVRAIHEEIRDAVVSACEKSSQQQLSEVDHDGPGDTIYAIDRISDSRLVELFDQQIASREPIVLIAEGIPDGKVCLPRGTREEDAVWRIIADPVDGTRCLMYQKRSGWILTGIAPNKGDATSLTDVEVAVQTEIPLVKQHLCDTLWASRGSGGQAERFNRLTGERIPFVPVPSAANGLSHGFASVSRFFSGGRDILASIDDEIHFAVLGAGAEGKARCFEDQYLSTGGQLYELMMGHDRFIADLRPLLRPILERRGWAHGLCCHPYDLSTELIAREAGVIVTDEKGGRLNPKLNVETDVSWAGYANEYIRNLVEPRLQSALRSRGVLAVE
jgi:fructose-1,6-bisphosphatase/inositol monophosphatase family enzyme